MANPPGAAATATRTSPNLAYANHGGLVANVHATSANLPPGKNVDLTWGTVTGGWVVEDNYHFGGKKYAESVGGCH
jgi:hypothetical protein